MHGKPQNPLLRNLLLLLTISVAYVQSALYVPALQQSSYELIPTENQYQLRLTLPDGSTRYETVELRAEGTPEEELHIMGVVENYFELPHNGKSVSIYEAGKDGYVVKYKFESLPPEIYPFEVAPSPKGISAGGLKSAAG